MSLALRVDVDPYDLCQWSEIPLPHLQRSTLIDPDFEKCHRPVLPRRKVALVDWKVVNPLVDDFVLIGQKILPEIHVRPLHITMPACTHNS